MTNTQILLEQIERKREREGQIKRMKTEMVGKEKGR